MDKISVVFSFETDELVTDRRNTKAKYDMFDFSKKFMLSSEEKHQTILN